MAHKNARVGTRRGKEVGEFELRFVCSSISSLGEAVVEGRPEELGCENKLGIEGGGQLCSPVLKSRSQLSLHFAPFFSPTATRSRGKKRGLGTTLQPFSSCRDFWGSREEDGDTLGTTVA